MNRVFAGSFMAILLLGCAELKSEMKTSRLSPAFDSAMDDAVGSALADSWVKSAATRKGVNFSVFDNCSPEYQYWIDATKIWAAGATSGLTKASYLSHLEIHQRMANDCLAAKKLKVEVLEPPALTFPVSAEKP